MGTLQSSLRQAREENTSLQEKVSNSSLLGRELAETREKEVRGSLDLIHLQLSRSYFSC